MLASLLRTRLSELRPLFRSPLTWIVAVVAVVRLVGIGWGLPASDGWDNDGVAPRDFLAGLAATFTPGQFYTYPPLHLALLAVLTLPVTLIVPFRARSLALGDLVQEILRVPYMTAIALVARLTSCAMSIAIVIFLARLAEEIRAHELGLPPERAREDRRVRIVGYATAAFAGAGVSLTYYAHTTNLDVPYLFWASWALLVLARAVARGQPRLLRRAFALAALAISTKDQAYALFLLSVPAVLLLWATGSPKDRRALLRETAIGAALAAALLLLVDGALVNPSGFRARLAFLAGSASQDYVEYTNDWSGRLRILLDFGTFFHHQYTDLLAPVVLLGLARALLSCVRPRASGRPGQIVLALLPLLAAVSFTVAFNWSARRSDPRFMMPQAVALAVYGGFGVAWLVDASHRLARLAGQAFVSVAFAHGIFLCLSVDANILGDPRYDTESWLAAHVRPGDTIETYGLNVYLPRFPARAHVVRVGPEPVDRRNPLPGVEEVEAPFEDAPRRGARFIVVSTAWVWRYLPGPLLPGGGRQRPPTQARMASDAAAKHFFEQLERGDGPPPFTRVHVSTYDDHLFPVVDVHGTLCRWVWIFERKP